MRAPEQESTATAALNYVAGDFSRIGWGPMVNALHDLGTDLFIQVRDDRRFDRGLVVGAQVKGGPSWFNQPHLRTDGVADGWWFYERSADHFDDWVTHGLPHLVVLYDFERRKSYWAHVTADKCISTGKGCKILVPAGQTVDPEHLDALLDVASAQRAASTFEQRVFNARAANAPPGRRLRYALLTPRLIAPHGNAGYTVPPEPEEYLALIIGRRSSQISRFQKKFPELAPSALKTHRDWRWRFAYALDQWLEHDASSDLSDCLLTAQDAASRAAACAALVSSYVQHGKLAEAHRLLDEVIAGDESSPVDHGWLLIHRATIRTEVGDIEGARYDAARATKSLRCDDDPTVSLLAGVSATILYTTAGFGSGDLSSVINSNDTAPAWWRAQMLSWALARFDDTVFENWSGSTNVTFRASDEGLENLEASCLNALLASDHDAWRSIVSRKGRYIARFAHHCGDELLLVQGLDQLRRAGDGKNLKLAVTLIRNTGPILSVRQAAERAEAESITRTTASATLSLWAAAADALEESHAAQLASWCLQLLSDGKMLKDFSSRFGQSFRPESAAIEALRKLLPVGGLCLQRSVEQILLKLPSSSTLAQEWAGVAFALDRQVFDPHAFFEKAVCVEDHSLKNALLYRLACNGDAAAKNLLVERAPHDLNALHLIPERDKLDTVIVEKLQDILRRRIDEVRQAASRGSYGFGGVDAARIMTHLNILHPGKADWIPIFKYLSDLKVLRDHKNGAVACLIAYYDQLSEEVRFEIRQALPNLLSSRTLPFALGKEHPEAAWHLQIISSQSASEQACAVADFLSGHTSQRRVAAQLIGRGIAPDLAPALHPLISDESLAVRSSAAFALGRMCGKTSNIDGKCKSLVARIATDSGALRPSSFLQGITEGPIESPHELIDFVDLLTSHGSFEVRSLAQEVLSACT